MKKNYYVVPMMCALYGLYSSLVFASGFSVKVTPAVSETKTPPGCYYTYKAYTNKEISVSAIALWNNLNKFTNANMDLALLKNSETAERINIKTDKILFDVYNPAAMGFLYSKSLTSYLRPDGKASGMLQLLKKDRALVAAKEYLGKLNLLPPSTDEMFFEQTNTIRGAASTSPNDIYDFLQVVRFGRKLDGIKVIGPTRIVVRLGKDGELVSVIKDWPKLVKNDVRSETYDNSQWNQVITTYLESKYDTSGIWSSVAVDNVELVMYDDGENVVEPALLAKGNRIDLKGGSFPYDWVIPVLKEPKAKYKGNGAEPGAGLKPEMMR